MYPGYLLASCDVVTAGLTTCVGTDTSRPVPVVASACSTRAPSAAWSTTTPLADGPVLSPLALGVTVASRAGRSTPARTFAVSARTALSEYPTCSLTSRFRGPPNRSRNVREKIEPSRLTATARATSACALTTTPAWRGSSVQVRWPERTVTGSLRGPIKSRWTFVRAAASLRPPTATPLIVTPLAIRSRREWSYSRIAASRTTTTPITRAITSARGLRLGRFGWAECGDGVAIVGALILASEYRYPSGHPPTNRVYGRAA